MPAKNKRTMRFTCQPSALREGLQTVTRALASRTMNPILECILLEAKEMHLQITASNERLTVITRVECEVAESGSGILPGKLFNEIVKRLPDAQTEISMDDRHAFKVISGTSRTNIAGQDSDLFPERPSIEVGRELTIPQDMLRDMIQKVEFAIASDNAREVLTGIYLEIANGNISTVACDGFRMAIRSAKCSDVDSTVSAIIPGNAAKDIAKLLGGGEAPATLAFQSNKLRIGLGRTDIFVQLINGEYINYRGILPKHSTIHARAALEDLRGAIDRVALMANEVGNWKVRFHIHSAAMDLEASSNNGDAHESIPVELEGGRMTIFFSVSFLRDIMRSMDSERIQMDFTTSTSPCIITPVGDSDYMHLILPVRGGQ